MPLLQNPRWEKFAQAVAGGMTASEAYRQIGGKGQGNANVHAARMMANDNIRARVKELQEASATSMVMSMKERREFLARVVRAKIGEVDDNSDLVQKIKRTEAGLEVWMPDKRACIELDAKLSGELVEKREHTGAPATGITVLTEPERLQLIARRREMRLRIVADREKNQNTDPIRGDP